MRRELRDRREQTWELLVLMGIPYGETVERIAAEYDVRETTVESDINRMEDWLPNLDVNYYSGISRLRELRQARQRQHQLSMEARREDDRELERKVLRDRVQNIETDVHLSQRLGLANEEPSSIEFGNDVDEMEERLLENATGGDVSDEEIAAEHNGGGDVDLDPAETTTQ